jgi:NADH:ubiquinone oxidoreductase subunit 4 (subunit M)
MFLMSDDEDGGRYEATVLMVVTSALSLCLIALDAMLFAASIAALAAALIVFSAKKGYVRSSAAITATGFLVFIATLFYAGTKTGSFNALSIYAHKFSALEEIYLFIAASVAVAMIVGVFPFHRVLKDEICFERTFGGVGASVLFLVGVCCAYRYILPSYPVAATYFSKPAMMFLVAAAAIPSLGAVSCAFGGELVARILSAQAALVFFGL